jgi:hypothetical protein
MKLPQLPNLPLGFSGWFNVAVKPDHAPRNAFAP